MTDLVTYIVKQLVNNPDAVSVEETGSNGEVYLKLSVDPADMGIVIGRAGQTIKAIRRILTIRAMSENVRVSLELNEPEGSERQLKSEEGDPSAGARDDSQEPEDDTESVQDDKEPADQNPE